MNPPKCRICGKEEWNHLCSGPVTRAAKIKAARSALAAPKKQKPEKRRTKRKN